MNVWLCDDCLEQIPRVNPPFCTRCGNPVTAGSLCVRCQTAPMQIEHIRSAVYFGGALRQAVHQFKYQGCTALAKPLSKLMVESWRQDPMSVDLVVPVPLHTTRLRERGYNQAALLAQEMARQVELTIDEQTLVRQRATSPQVELNAKQRKQNVSNAFQCSSDGLAGARVLLVDDVCTTGATLEACTMALHTGGVRSVQSLTLARAR